MATPCTVPMLETILKGDAVCVTGYDAVNSQPIVKRASRDNLLTSKTVFGVAETDDDGLGSVSIRVAGEVCEDDITALGNVGGSRIVATDVNNVSGLEEDQCRLIRVDRPDGSEHVVGTCDANGHLSVQPRASRDTSAQHVFNVKSYGAKGDGRRIDHVFINDGVNSMSATTLYSSSAPFTAADTGKTVQVIGAGFAGQTLTTTITYVDANNVTLGSPVTTAVEEGRVLIVGTDDHDAIHDAAVAASAVSGRLFFPPGIYCPATSDISIASNVQVFFDEGASLEPNGVNVDIAGHVSCHAHQQVFGGTGYSTTPAAFPPLGPLPAVTAITGDPVVEAVVHIKVVASGTIGGVPAMQFQFSADGGATWSTARTPPGPVAYYDFPMPGLGITVTFDGAASYTAGDECTWTSYPAITLAADSFHLHNARNFGAYADDPNTGAANIAAFRKCLGAAYNATNPETVRIVAHGQFYLGGTLHVMRPILMDGGGHGDKDTGPGTTLIFPTDATGIRFHSSDPAELRALAGAHDDVPDGLPIYRTGASQSELRSVTVRCDVLRGAVPTGVGWQDVYGTDIRANIEAYGHHGHGIHTSTPIVLRDVFVQNFAEHGVYVAAAHGDDAIGGHPGNAAGTHLVNVVSSKHGGHGFFFIGGDANVSLIEMCGADVNYGNGFREYAGTGNTYVACYCQGNAGMVDNVGAPEVPNFGTDYHNHDFYVVGYNVNYSTFFGCYSEASIDRILFPASAFGGNLSGENFIAGDLTAFGLLGGVMSGGPLKYRARSAQPNSSFVNVGAPPTRSDEFLRFGRLILGDERSPTWLTHVGNSNRWTLYNESPGRAVLEVPTVESHDRYAAPCFPNGIFIGTGQAGSEADPSGIDRRHWRIASLFPPPATQSDSVSTAATYEKGDVVWQIAPEAGGALGQVCLKHGTQTQLRTNPSTTGTFVDANHLTLTGADLSSFAAGKYVTIDGVTGAFEITGPLVGTTAPVTTMPAFAGTPAVNVVMVVTSIDVVDPSIITVDDSTGLVPGQYITIDGVGYQVKGLGTGAYLDCSNADDSSPSSYDFSSSLDLDVWIDLRGVQTITIPALGAGTTAADVVTVLNAAFHAYGADSAVAETTGAGDHYVRIRSNTTGQNSRVAVTGGSANAVLGFTTDNITRVFGTTETFPMAGESFTLSVDGGVTTVPIAFGTENTQQKVIATINAAMGFECAVAQTSTLLVIQGRERGESIIISPPAMGTSALTKLGLVAGTTRFYVPGAADATTVTLTSAALFAAPPPPQAIQYTPATFAPFGTVHTRGDESGQLTLDMSATQTLTDAQAYSATMLQATSVGAGGVTLFFPKPQGDEDSYQRTIRVPDALGNPLDVDVEGGGMLGPVTVVPGSVAIVGFDPSGAFVISAT